MQTIYNREKPSNILLVAITRMGDMLQATPMIVGMKRQYPEAKITVAIEKNFAAICDGIPGIDEVIPLDLAYICQCLHREREGIVEAYSYLSKMIEDLRDKKFDFVYNMSSSAYTALLLKMIDAKENRGWISDDEGFRLISNPWAMLFAAFVYHSNRDYNSINLVDIFRCSADVYEHPETLVYEVPDSAKNFGINFIKESGITGTGPIIGIQAGASQEKRQWAPRRFAELCRRLVEECDARIVFTGSKSEQRIIDQIFSHYSHSNMLSAAGKTSINELASLLTECKLLITGDTGTMHLAVAVGTPVVALFLASALCFETGPYRAGCVVLQPQIVCNPCNPNLPCARPDCHEQITPELITYVTKKRLELSDHELSNLVIPPTLCNPADVTIYVTEFDNERFLKFKEITPSPSRHGQTPEFFPSARNAYRSLWKRELKGVSTDYEIDLSRASTTTNLNLPEPVKSSLLQMVERSKSGIELLNQLIKCIDNPSTPPNKLGELAVEIKQTDRELENIGLRCGILGALVRMFIMERDNLRGEDALQLAKNTMNLYQNLVDRTNKFGSLFSYYLTESTGFRNNVDLINKNMELRTTWQ
jgi:ADP-heptose:LPS heptosyltransferase